MNAVKRVAREFALLLLLTVGFALVIVVSAYWLGGVTRTTTLCGDSLEQHHLRVAGDEIRPDETSSVKLEFLDIPADKAPDSSPSTCIRIEEFARVPSPILMDSPPIPDIPYSDVQFVTESHTSGMALVAMAPLGALVIMLVLLGTGPSRATAQPVESRPRNAASLAFASAIGLLLAAILMSVSASAWPEDIAFIRRTSSIVGDVLLALLVVLAVPLLEESFFRGVLFRRMLEANAPLLGLFMVSGMFTGLHALGFMTLIGTQGAFTALGLVLLSTFLGSAVLCGLYWWKRRLRDCIVLHGSYNAGVIGLGLLLHP
ncbi:MAG: CPBP family intramembrane metalloprotease [Gammaproteobacteria bacterium]|nr:CPBP family intramembrane metalloprotease [Gammaproteobacteria bacterium]